MTTDNAGGSFTSPAITVRVDNTAPTGSVTAPAAGANLRGTVGLTSDSADGGSGVATVQFQRSPAGAGSWTNQAASWNTTLLTDGLYDLRVVTTDNAGGSFTSTRDHRPRRQHRADRLGHRAGERRRDRRAAGDADEQLGRPSSRWLSFRRRHRPLRAASRRRWRLDRDALDAGIRLRARTRSPDGSYELRVTTTDLAGNSFTSSTITVLVDHTAPVTSASAVARHPSNAPVTVTFSADDGTGSGVAQTSYRVDGGSIVAAHRSSSPRRAATRTTARTWSSSSPPTTSATPRR